MAIDPSRIQALCFDLDGTLSYTDDQFVLRFARMLKPLSFAFKDRNHLPFARRVVMFTEAPGNYLLGIPDRFNWDQPLANFGDYLYQKGLGQHSEPFLIIHGVAEMLAELSQRYPMSVVSARGERSALRFLDQFDLRKYFQAIACAHTCVHTKPFPDPILWAARQMGAAPQHCLMVGDTTVDIRAGKAAGAQTAGVLCGFGEENELRRAGADQIFSSTADLLPFLKS